MPRSRRNADSLLTAAWRRRGFVAWLLLPASLIFAGLSALRRWLYRCGTLPSERLPVPVVIVGNLCAGGSGKTPLVLYLAQQLALDGLHPGLLSRGYGGNTAGICEVRHDSDPQQVGDEPLLLKRRFGGPVFVGRKRVAAARALLAAYPACDVILCDDGLQHYALVRDVEIAVIDSRGLMNGWLLPAGPLREPVRRLAEVHAIVLHGLENIVLHGPQIFRMKLAGTRFYSLEDPARECAAEHLRGLHLHAVAGIGDPPRFFDHLKSLGIACETHAFPDHHVYSSDDLALPGDAILTTEKDAVKFSGLTRLPVWVLPVDAQVEPDLARFLSEKLNGHTAA